jgi:FPC/CPF motif-containing protein YcgG
LTGKGESWSLENAKTFEDWPATLRKDDDSRGFDFAIEGESAWA